jgi:hypothetical protein
VIHPGMTQAIWLSGLNPGAKTMNATEPIVALTAMRMLIHHAGRVTHPRLAGVPSLSPNFTPKEGGGSDVV